MKIPQRKTIVLWKYLNCQARSSDLQTTYLREYSKWIKTMKCKWCSEPVGLPLRQGQEEVREGDWIPLGNKCWVQQLIFNFVNFNFLKINLKESLPVWMRVLLPPATTFYFYSWSSLRIKNRTWTNTTSTFWGHHCSIHQSHMSKLMLKEHILLLNRLYWNNGYLVNNCSLSKFNLI